MLTWLSAHADAAWSAGFLAVWMGLIQHDEEPPYAVVYALAGLVVDRLVRPIEREGRSTLYQYIPQPRQTLEEHRLFDPDETDRPAAAEVRPGGQSRPDLLNKEAAVRRADDPSGVG